MIQHTVWFCNFYVLHHYIFNSPSKKKFIELHIRVFKFKTNCMDFTSLYKNKFHESCCLFSFRYCSSNLIAFFLLFSFYTERAIYVVYYCYVALNLQNGGFCGLHRRIKKHSHGWMLRIRSAPAVVQSTWQYIAGNLVLPASSVTWADCLCLLPLQQNCQR